MTTPTPHPHAALIKQWADDPSIALQARVKGSNFPWVNTGAPQWLEGNEYRIKPAPEPVYTLTLVQLRNLVSTAICQFDNTRDVHQIIKHAEACAAAICNIPVKA